LKFLPRLQIVGKEKPKREKYRSEGPECRMNNQERVMISKQKGVGREERAEH